MCFITKTINKIISIFRLNVNYVRRMASISKNLLLQNYVKSYFESKNNSLNTTLKLFNLSKSSNSVFMICVEHS